MNNDIQYVIALVLFFIAGGVLAVAQSIHDASDTSAFEECARRGFTRAITSDDEDIIWCVKTVNGTDSIVKIHLSQ